MPLPRASSRLTASEMIFLGEMRWCQSCATVSELNDARCRAASSPPAGDLFTASRLVGGATRPLATAPLRASALGNDVAPPSAQWRGSPHCRISDRADRVRKGFPAPKAWRDNRAPGEITRSLRCRLAAQNETTWRRRDFRRPGAGEFVCERTRPRRLHKGEGACRRPLLGCARNHSRQPM